MNVRLVHNTPDAEKLMAYCARVSSSKQDNPDYEKLLGYCIKHKHWSVFEMASVCIEIKTSRAIAQQILRHRSFHFQEFSQRYAEAQYFEIYEARRQDLKNRQNSIDDMSDEEKNWFDDAQTKVISLANELYDEALRRGIAKEQARFLLPLNTESKLYMHGTVRDWIHYINLRAGNGTQLEHQEIAIAIKDILIDIIPTIAKAMNWQKSK
jgi:thymidylate synthase (FAD)